MMLSNLTQEQRTMYAHAVMLGRLPQIPDRVIEWAVSSVSDPPNRNSMEALFEEVRRFDRTHKLSDEEIRHVILALQCQEQDNRVIIQGLLDALRNRKYS